MTAKERLPEPSNPLGMDGIEFITMLNEFHPEIVPIMVTAYSSIDTVSYTHLTLPTKRIV